MSKADKDQVKAEIIEAMKVAGEIMRGDHLGEYSHLAKDDPLILFGLNGPMLKPGTVAHMALELTKMVLDRQK